MYLPEVCELVCNVTGAKNAIVNNCAFRRKHAERQADPNFYLKKGDALDLELGKMERDTPMVYGKEAGGSLEPSRITHIDYSVEGLRRTARDCRKDITEMARACIDKEAKGEKARYAAFSVWRPVKTVRRDPLAVCDWRSLDKSLLKYWDYRCLSNVKEGGEYMMDACGITVPDEKQKQQMKWYWMPEQQTDEVLIVKFADTLAEWDESVTAGCPHSSPVVVGTENEKEARMSIECRVLAFWE